MIYIENLTKISEDKYSIGYIHYMPFNEENGLKKTKEELLSTGKLIDNVPAEQIKEGFISKIYYRPSKNELFYEYEKMMEQSKQTTIEDLQKQLDATNMAIAELSSLIMSK